MLIYPGTAQVTHTPSLAHTHTREREGEEEEHRVVGDKGEPERVFEGEAEAECEPERASEGEAEGACEYGHSVPVNLLWH